VNTTTRNADKNTINSVFHYQKFYTLVS